MFRLKESSVEWALKHVTHFYASDFFPREFEFEAMAHEWADIKAYILGFDLHEYVPNTPLVSLALKPNGTFRVVHQLDPIDSIIYTALVYEVAAKIEQYRIPRDEKIVWSYRIRPSVKGSFFNREEDTWRDYMRQTRHLATQFRDGFVVTCDLVDFYDQIYTHRIQNLIVEACGPSFEGQGKAMEKFLLGLNTLTSRGVPVGPAPSIIIAELVASDIDKKILSYTRHFVRWVDDISIFFRGKNEAERFLYELTLFIHENHRLVFSGEKTRVLSVDRFLRDLRDPEAEEKKRVKTRSEKRALEEYYEEVVDKLGPYGVDDDDFNEDRFNEVLAEIQKDRRHEILSEVYSRAIDEELATNYPEFAVVRSILRNAGKYRVRSIFQSVLKNFEKLLPLVREVVLYLLKVLTKELVEEHEDKFRKILENPRMQLPFVNTWLAALLEHSAFGVVDLPQDYEHVHSIRSQALVAMRRNDRTWVKGHKNGVDTLGPWEKRAVLYSGKILSKDERQAWMRVASRRGTKLEKAVTELVMAVADA